jgi:hypothetical protein
MDSMMYSMGPRLMSLCEYPLKRSGLPVSKVKLPIRCMTTNPKSPRPVKAIIIFLPMVEKIKSVKNRIIIIDYPSKQIDKLIPVRIIATCFDWDVLLKHQIFTGKICLDLFSRAIIYQKIPKELTTRFPAKLISQIGLGTQWI